ncbi:MAG: YidC/Oxa1 family insertase periplasmic-domain containing protein [Sedimentisphaerales bacterium]|nr:YidC/Oxa1 family insertase periplasmic-domain containing protein [Sedimentisphaerales bacterium]
MRYLKWILISFVVCCVLLIAKSIIFWNSPQRKISPILLQEATTTDIPAMTDEPEAEDANTPENSRMQADNSVSFGADHAEDKKINLGAKDPNTEDPKTGFKYRVELSSKGAAIYNATFSYDKENKTGFGNRDKNNPLPLEVIKPAKDRNGREILAMANTDFELLNYKKILPLKDLFWQSSDVNTQPDGSQSARFEAIIKNEQTGEQVIKFTKTYTVRPETYLLECDITIVNQTSNEQEVRFNLAGPGGLTREGFRSDMRSVMAGVADVDGTIGRVKLDKKGLLKADTLKKMQLAKENTYLLWAASVNKYFAFIARPVPDEGKNYCDWIEYKTGRLYNPDGDSKANSGDEMLGVDLNVTPVTLAATGETGDTKTYKFQLYIGPKDKSLFNKNQMYKSLGFDQTIDFMACCCPAGIIYPLAFGIMAMMKWMYGFIPNYGVVIIILVFLVRLVLHPITKKSQVSMSKMSKLGPMTEEIKKKYANNKAEMNKQIMALYREQGASPIMGFLPMLIQMPILIALWSAIYTSIDLRGAGFLSFWITDLSVPDALFPLPNLTIPLLGWKISSFNLLPILMGVAMYFQQALMPTQAAANPQVAQQQKMMKIMFPIMLPIILYNGPAGVNLYFMSSTFAGVIEQHVIRKHIRDKEEAESKGLVAATKKTGGKVKKKKPKPFYKNM